MSEPRLIVRLAANYLRTASLNMGDVMDMLATATTPDEADHLRDAYIDATCGDGVDASAARERCDTNIRFGADYMERRDLLALYFPSPSKEENNG